MTVGATPRLGLTTWSADTDQVDRAQFAATLTALDAQCMPDAEDLAANIGNFPPSVCFWFHALDTDTDYVGTGTKWEALLHRVDTTTASASLPSGSSVNKGQYYWTSDSLQLYRSNGASMIVVEDAINVPPPQPPPLGTIITLLPSASVNAASATWLPCNGASLNTTTYAALFDIIGYQYGGSGSSFNLPTVGGFQGIGRPSQLAEAGSAASVSFGYSGALQTWTAPAAGVWGGSVNVVCIGGGGGGAEGGVGASVGLTYTGISPSEVLDIYVGGEGQEYTYNSGGGYAYGYHVGGAPYDIYQNELTYGVVGNYGTIGFGGCSSAVTFSNGTLLCEAGAGGGQGWLYADTETTSQATFNYTSDTTQTWTAPSNVTGPITIVATGAGGSTQGGTGGAGAVVTFNFTVSPSQVLTMYVGQPGGGPTTGYTSPGGWGYNNGASAYSDSTSWGGGGGGGATAVLNGGTVLAIAGGGGGGAGSNGAGYTGAGGAGGNPNGASGQAETYVQGGGGGTGSGPGAGGSGEGGSGTGGSNGSGGAGGAGGAFNNGAGGGGGGGYYGGGGGGAQTYSGIGIGGGGGGGSSYSGGGATNVSYSVAGSAVGGTVVITYSTVAGSPTYNQAVGGGNGGQSNGAAGSTQTFGSAYSNGGGGGTQAAGGTGGAWQSATPGVTSGQAENGVLGGSPDTVNGGQGYGQANGGGGGGGGYAGGGAGALSTYLAQGAWNANEWSGGGGGSSYVATGSGSGTSNIGYASAGSVTTGQVIISYTAVSYYTPVSPYPAYIRAK